MRGCIGEKSSTKNEKTCEFSYKQETDTESGITSLSVQLMNEDDVAVYVCKASNQHGSAQTEAQVGDGSAASTISDNASKTVRRMGRRAADGDHEGKTAVDAFRAGHRHSTETIAITIIVNEIAFWQENTNGATY